MKQAFSIEQAGGYLCTFLAQTDEKSPVSPCIPEKMWYTVKGIYQIQECKNPIVEDDFHGFLHRNCEGTEQLRKEKEREIYYL